MRKLGFLHMGSELYTAIAERVRDFRIEQLALLTGLDREQIGRTVPLNSAYPADEVAQATEIIWNMYQKRGTLYGAANGGTVGVIAGSLGTDFGQHIFASLDGDKSRVLEGAPAFLTRDLVGSTAVLTGIVNDMGADQMYARQLDIYGFQEGDVLLGISGSGNSGNVVNAVTKANDLGGRSIAITGARNEGGKLAELADVCIVVPGVPGGSRFPGQVGKNDSNFFLEGVAGDFTHMMVGILSELVWRKYGSQR
jgi:D-sedoheptulose 7-phosphate isomerase